MAKPNMVVNIEEKTQATNSVLDLNWLLQYNPWNLYDGGAWSAMNKLFHNEIQKAVKFFKQYIIFFLAIYIGWVVATSYMDIEKTTAYLAIEFGLGIGILGMCAFLIYKISKAKRDMQK